MANKPLVNPTVHDALLFPDDAGIYQAVARRVEDVLGEQGDLFQSVARAVLSGERHILSPQPKTTWPIVVVRSCVSAGGDWLKAVWPAAALEIAMTACDVFDDLTDGEDVEVIARFGPGTVLTIALGLLSLAGATVLRAVDDGCDPTVAVALGRLIGDGIATAADGQARGFPVAGEVKDVVDAYQLAAAKSGPLGDLAARLGAAVATTDPMVVDLYGTFGWHLGVSAQLANDARDVMPNRPLNKQDVRDGSPTVPLVFSESAGAPAGLNPNDLIEWETTERRRIADRGGIVLTEVLAIADQLRAEAALTKLEGLGHRTEGLRKLLVLSDQAGC
ncbi:MAG: polyprenyl synthetase family protein [Chloroflexota bacterium]